MAQQYKIYKYRWVVLILYMYIAALTQLYWLNFAAIETYLENSLHIPASQVMWFTLVFPLVQVILTLPAGVLIDRKGFKYGIGLGAIFTGIFAIFRLISPQSFAILLISQIGISVGQPFVLNGITKLATTWFSPKQEALAVGLGSFALFIGMMIALGLTPLLVESTNFGTMIWIYGIAGIIGAILFLVFARSQPKTPSRALETNELASGWSSIKDILKIRNFVILGFVALIGIGVFNGIATWLEKMLNEIQGMSLTDAGNLSALLVLSGMIGCVVIPLISDKIRRRKPLLVIASIVGAIAVFFLMISKNFAANVVDSVFLGFFFISALPIMLTMSVEITGPRYAGVSVGYLQLLGNGAAVILIYLMETLRSTTASFALPIILLVCLLAISFVLSLLLKDTRV
jgi:MFS family permease